MPTKCVGTVSKPSDKSSNHSMKSAKVAFLIVLTSSILLSILGWCQSSPKPMGVTGGAAVENGTQSDVGRQIEDVRASLQKQIDELRVENAQIREQVLLIRKIIASALSSDASGNGQETSRSENILRLRVKGNSPRSVYGSPNSGIIGKVEPGTILRAVQVVETGGNRWYLCVLEKGQMYTSEPPARTLDRGWIWASALEPVQ